MKPRPPHLPKQEEAPVHQTQKHSLFYFFSCAFISIAASLSTVFVALSWIVPHAVPEVQFYSFQHDTPTSVATVTPDIISRISEREALLYDKKNKLGGSWYGAGSALSTGVFLTSDGWAVFPLENNFDEVLKKDATAFEVIDNRGVSYTVSKIIFDKDFHLVYAQVQGSGFHFVSFSNWQSLKVDAVLIGKKYEQYELDKLVGVKNTGAFDAIEMWKPQYRFVVGIVDSGMVFDEQGEVLGVAQGSGVLPGWYIETALGSILSTQTLSYSAFPWKGQFVDHVLESGFVKAQEGFFITDLNGDKNKNGLKVGDVIVKIQNKDITPITLSSLLLSSSDMVVLDLIRDGKPLQKILPKQILNF